MGSRDVTKVLNLLLRLSGPGGGVLQTSEHSG